MWLIHLRSSSQSPVLKRDFKSFARIVLIEFLLLVGRASVTGLCMFVSSVIMLEFHFQKFCSMAPLLIVDCPFKNLHLLRLAGDT